MGDSNDTPNVILTFDDDIEIHLPTQAIVNALLARLVMFIPWIFTLDGDMETRTKRYLLKKAILTFAGIIGMELPVIPGEHDWIKTFAVSAIENATQEITAKPWPITSESYTNEGNRIVYLVGAHPTNAVSEETETPDTDDTRADSVQNAHTNGQESTDITTRQDSRGRDNRQRQDDGSTGVSGQNPQAVSMGTSVHTGYKKGTNRRQSSILRPDFTHNGSS